MIDIPKHYFKKEWDKGIECNVVALQQVLELLHERVTVPHSHDFHQLVYIKNGQGFHEVDFELISLREGSLFLVTTEQIHTFVDRGFEGIAIGFTTSFVSQDQNFSKLFFDIVQQNALLPNKVIQCDAHTQNLIEMLYETFLGSESCKFIDMLQSYIRLILLKFYELGTHNCADHIASDLTSVAIEFNRELGKNLSYRCKVSDISERLNVSSKTLTRSIVKAMNKTPKEVMIERLILELKRLITYSDLTLKEIAHHMHFDDHANFTHFFKKHTGESPKSFREKMKAAAKN